MRSRLEAKAAGWFDRHEIPWVYEPNDFGNQHGIYAPDFELKDFGVAGRRKRPIYVEVKPTWEQARSARSRMLIIHSSDPYADLLMLAPGHLDFCFGHDHHDDPGRRWYWDEQVAWWKENGPWEVTPWRGSYHGWDQGRWDLADEDDPEREAGAFHGCSNCQQATLTIWSVQQYACARCGAYRHIRDLLPLDLDSRPWLLGGGTLPLPAEAAR